jgi:hypothetical protein
MVRSPLRRSRKVLAATIVERIALLFLPTRVINVTTAKHLAAKEKTTMSNVTIENDKPAATPATEASPKKAAKRGKAPKKAKAAKTAKPAKKVAKPSERSNKKAEVIAMMKRAGGATLEAIMHTTGWQRHTVHGFVSILGSKGGQKIESAKNAPASARTA